MYLAINLLTLCVLPIIAGGCHDDDAGIYQATHRATDRIVLVRVNCRCSEAHIDNLDVVSGLVRYHPVNGAQNCRRGARTSCPEHAQVDQICIGCNTDVLPIRNTAVAGSERRDVCAVPKRVVRSSLSGKITADNYAPIIVAIQKGGMVGIDSGIKHSNSDSRTV